MKKHNLTKKSLIIYLPEDLWKIAYTVPLLRLKHIIYDKHGNLRDESERIRLLNEYFKEVYNL